MGASPFLEACVRLALLLRFCSASSTLFGAELWRRCGVSSAAIEGKVAGSIPPSQAHLVRAETGTLTRPGRLL